MSECILKVNNLTKFYNNVKVLDGVSFTIEQGKIYGFIGENGAGKTTTIRILVTIFASVFVAYIKFRKEELK